MPQNFDISFDENENSNTVIEKFFSNISIFAPDNQINQETFEIKDKKGQKINGGKGKFPIGVRRTADEITISLYSHALEISKNSNLRTELDCTKPIKISIDKKGKIKAIFPLKGLLESRKNLNIMKTIGQIKTKGTELQIDGSQSLEKIMLLLKINKLELTCAIIESLSRLNKQGKLVNNNCQLEKKIQSTRSINNHRLYSKSTELLIKQSDSARKIMAYMLSSSREIDEENYSAYTVSKAKGIKQEISKYVNANKQDQLPDKKKSEIVSFALGIALQEQKEKLKINHIWEGNSKKLGRDGYIKSLQHDAKYKHSANSGERKAFVEKLLDYSNTNSQSFERIFADVLASCHERGIDVSTMDQEELLKKLNNELLKDISKSSEMDLVQLAIDDNVFTSNQRAKLLEEQRKKESKQGVCR